MAKTLGKLRTQTLKLRELEPPKDVSKGTKAFVRKHVYVVHPDANENGDDVFKAKNIKKVKRAPDHGYEPGEDEDIYEGVYKKIDTREKEKARLQRANDSVTMKKGRKRGESLKDDHRGSRRQEGQRLIDRQRTEETEDLGEMRGLATLMAVRAATRAVRNQRAERNAKVPKQRPLKKNGKLIPTDKSGYWDQKEETNLDEIINLPAIVSALRAGKAGPSGGNDASYRAKTAALKAKRLKGELLLKPSMRNDPDQVAKTADLDAKIGRLAQYKTDMAVVAKRKVAKDYWGEETEMRMNENENVDDRNSEHHYMHNMILDHIDQIHKKLSAHVSLMDNMNDAHHETHFHKLSKIHDSLDDISEKLYQMHQGARAKMGMNPTPPNEGNRDLGGKPMVGNAFPHSEDYEHIAAMSESDQALLVDTYNSLTEENQERFLELAESEEGCDKLLDFCITSRGND